MLKGIPILAIIGAFVLNSTFGAWECGDSPTITPSSEDFIVTDGPGNYEFYIDDCYFWVDGDDSLAEDDVARLTLTTYRIDNDNTNHRLAAWAGNPFPWNKIHIYELLRDFSAGNLDYEELVICSKSPKMYFQFAASGSSTNAEGFNGTVSWSSDTSDCMTDYSEYGTWHPLLVLLLIVVSCCGVWGVVEAIRAAGGSCQRKSGHRV